VSTVLNLAQDISFDLFCESRFFIFVNITLLSVSELSFLRYVIEALINHESQMLSGTGLEFNITDTILYKYVV
jgi:hypothetical protein